MGRIGTAASVLLALAAIAVISLTTSESARPPSPEPSRSEFVGPVAAGTGQVVAAARQVEVTTAAPTSPVSTTAAATTTAGATATTTVSTTTSAAVVTTAHPPGHLFEDEPGWVCGSMGNHRCGGAVVTTTSTPTTTTTTASTGCDPNYGGCVPVATDVDCEGGGGDGPAYVAGPVPVTGEDVYDLDRDDDGQGCDEGDGAEAITPAATGAATFGPGVYAVGTGSGQIAPGRYASTGPIAGGAGTCYYARLRNNDGGVENIIANNITEGPNILDVAATDAYVQISGCTFTRA